jgi:uncharacterized protein YeeX (DUF496 family)
MCILQNNRNTRRVLELIHNETMDIPIHEEEFLNEDIQWYVNEAFEEDELEIDVETVEVVSYNQFPGTICLFKIDTNDTFYVLDGLFESSNREQRDFERLYDMYVTSPFNLDLCHYMITHKEFFPHSVEFLASADFSNQSSSTMTHMTDYTRAYYYVIRLEIYTGEEVDNETHITIFDKHVLTIKNLKDFMEHDMSPERTDIKTFYIVVEHRVNENVNQGYNVDFTINLH